MSGAGRTDAKLWLGQRWAGDELTQPVLVLAGLGRRQVESERFASGSSWPNQINGNTKKRFRDYDYFIQYSHVYVRY